MAAADKTTDTDLKKSDVDENPSEVSGQNTPLPLEGDARNIQEQGEYLARVAEAQIYGEDEAAGEDYLYPDLPPSAQNPLKRNVIFTKDEPPTQL